MLAPTQASDQAAAASYSEKSNAWNWHERTDIYYRRQEGERWETICLDYPHRSKHAMEQQYSIMKKQAALNTPVKSNDGRRKASVNALPSAINGIDGADSNSEDESSSDQDEPDSDDISTGFERRKSTRKPRLRRANSEESEKPKRRKSAPQQRLSKRLQRSTRDQIANDSDEPDEPVSARPKRTRAPPVNYNLLNNLDLDPTGESDIAVAPQEPERKSKIIALRTGPPKKLPVNAQDLDTKTPRRTLNADVGHEAPKTPAVHEDISITRKSTRGKKIADDNRPPNDDEPPNALRGELTTPRKRKRRLLAHLEALTEATAPVPATEPAKRSRKRKHSEDGVDQDREMTESEQPEKKRRRAKEKIREDLGLLPNGQPRKRRRRRTRQEMLLDQQTPKTVTTRHRGKYQFPYLPGYNGPSPPDMATVIARQDELERQNSASNLSTGHDSGSSLASLSDSQDSIPGSPMKHPDLGPIVTDINRSPTPSNQVPVSAVAPEQTPTVTAITPIAPSGVEASLITPDLVFFPDDLAKGRENAARLRAFYAEKDSDTKAFQANLAQEKQRVSELTQQLADLREGFTTRLNAEKQTHERAITALQASSDETQIKLTAIISDLSSGLKARDDTIERAKEEAKRFRDETSNEDGSRRPSLQVAETSQTAPAKMPSVQSPYSSAVTQPAALPPTPTTQNQTFKTLLSSLRNAHIRLAGHLRTTTEAHNVLKSSIRQLHTELEEDEITMRGVRNVVKGLVDGVGKVGGELEKAGKESDGVKGGVMELMDVVEH